MKRHEKEEIGARLRATITMDDWECMLATHLLPSRILAHRQKLK
jgi:hypothetical protein